MRLLKIGKNLLYHAIFLFNFKTGQTTFLNFFKLCILPHRAVFKAVFAIVNGGFDTVTVIFFFFFFIYFG
jgi:hypothetical protein